MAKRGRKAVAAKKATKTPTRNGSAKTEKEFNVERIVDKRQTKGGVEYCLKWSGYESDENTWEKVENLNCPDLIKEYEDSVNDKEKDDSAAEEVDKEEDDEAEEPEAKTPKAKKGGSAKKKGSAVKKGRVAKKKSPAAKKIKYTASRKSRGK
ncbi:chromobox-like protein [Leptotrombidium deliense]|uniref:Chromobox-like protein n=1 Tax=Leptotrombidium deliense TaxID=299467 RepID=A0A443S342_9ACAR|nr:chromobox-like protein [Leptotrombidium deliense]